MISEDKSRISHLSEEASWAFLLSETVGRLAVTDGAQPDIFPLNYVGHEGKVYFRTGEGTKLHQLVVDSHVAFEADGSDDTTAWSVVVSGSARAIESPDMVEVLNGLPLPPFAPTLSYVWVEIKPIEMRGRSFTMDPELKHN